jgi:hypothetical protein
MAVVAFGELTPAGATEEQFSGGDISTTGSLVLYVDLSSVILGSKVTIRAKRNVLTGGAIVTFFEGTYTLANLGSKGVITIPLGNQFLASFTVEYSAGTPTLLPWSIESL